MRKIFPAIVVALCVIFGAQYFEMRESAPPDATSASQSVHAPAHETDQALREAFEERRRDIQVSGTGTVARLLADDNDGDRHQRFILALESGQTVLIAHNIDLAPRIAELRAGDRVSFYGQYEWNQQGGVIHWTHHDPAGRHASGWLEHKDRRYE